MRGLDGTPGTHARPKTAARRRWRRATALPFTLEAAHDAFLTAVSHELRTPLTSVLGFAETLKGAPHLPPGDRERMIDRLAENARKLRRLVEDLLDLKPVTGGEARLQLLATDVAALASAVVEASGIVAARPVKIRGRDVIAEVDPAKLERILEALIANAAKHSPARTPILISVRAKRGGVVVSVGDRGPGIADDLKEDVFQPFYRGPTAPEHAPGLGIGLSLVARFAEMHGGRAWVEDRPGGGALFRVFLPGGATERAEASGRGEAS